MRGVCAVVLLAALDPCGQARLDLLPEALGVRVVVEVAHPADYRCKPRDAARLAWPLLFVQVGDPSSTEPDPVRPAPRHEAQLIVARMARKKVIRHRPTDRVELDALGDPGAIGQGSVVVRVEQVGLE